MECGCGATPAEGKLKLLKVMTSRRNAIQAFVRNESIWSQNNGSLFLRYQYILTFSDMIITKFVGSKSRFKKSSRKISPIWAFLLLCKGQFGALGRVKKFEPYVIQFFAMIKVYFSYQSKVQISFLSTGRDEIRHE